MIYLGDNWPAEYRGHLFTHNLGGHQINRQVNRPLGSGYDTVHEGHDTLFCTDPMYVAVDLQYGPDGAVYFIDWYDRQHCHNPNTLAAPEKDLEAEVAHFDTDEDLQAALVALLHPSLRTETDLDKQVEQLGWYKAELKKKLASTQDKADLAKAE
jgi:hypothetical protein